MRLRPSSALPLLAALCLGAAACEAAPAAPASPEDAAGDVALHGATPAELAALQASPLGPDRPVDVLRFRSEEDPGVAPDPDVCAAAPFASNVMLNASLWSEAQNASGARVVNSRVRRIGTATACVRITDPTFTPGLRQPFFARFRLPEGTLDALGDCAVVSNDVPRTGLVLAGCSLRVTDAPAWYAGGAVTSLSVFNPAGLPGFVTGSEWTVQLYRD